MADTSYPRYTRRERGRPLSFSTKVYQGIGAIPDNVTNWAFYTFTLLYYNQVLGMEAFLVSAALVVAIVFDAVSDLLVATYSDNLKTVWGRRHPLMLIAAVPMGASLLAVFVPPGGLSEIGLLIWLIVFTVLTRGFMTLYFVPWAAVAAELSDDYHERTSIMAYRFAIGWTVSIIGPIFVFTFLMPSTAEYPTGQLNPAGYPGMAIVVGLLVAGSAVATTLLTWREIPYLRQHADEPARFGLVQTVRELVKALGNKQFTLIFIIVLLSSAIGGTTANISIYMQTFFWGLTSEDLRWLAMSGLGVFIAFPLVAVVQKRWDKKHILLACALLSLVEGLVLVNLRFLGVLPENGDFLLLIILVASAVLAVIVGVVQGIIASSIVADLLDDHELRTGYRQEAMFNAALSFSGKAISGVGALFSGLILTFIAFPTNVEPSEVDPDAIVRLGVIIGVVTPLLYLIPTALITRYRITRERHAEIREALDARRQGQEQTEEPSMTTTVEPEPEPEPSI